MQRSAATILLFLFSFSLIGQHLLADLGSKLPACCRRDGKHGCSNSTSTHKERPSGAIIGSLAKCASYPATGALQASAKAFVPPVALRMQAINVTCTLDLPQTEAPYRAFSDRACQKRGPPSLA